MSKRALIYMCVLAAIFKTAVYAGPDEVSERISLAAFGADGEGLPSVAREQLNSDFFTRDITAALADGRNHTAMFTVPSGLEFPEVQLGAEERVFADSLKVEAMDLELHLRTSAQQASDVVVSAVDEKSRETRNFLVRVKPSAPLVVDAASLSRYDRIFFVGLHPFSVAIDVRINGGEARREVLEVLSPRRSADDSAGGVQTKSKTDYCVDKKNRPLQICNTAGCFTGWARRVHWYDNPTSGRTWYKVIVDYPAAGMPFHCHVSSLGSSSQPQCKATKYHTSTNWGKCTGLNNVHKWVGLDDTLFHGTQSTATCISGCTGTWTVN